MILGYIISGEFNDSQMFDIGLDSTIPICRQCGYVTDLEYISPAFRLKSKAFDYSVTYDSHVIVSRIFRDFCVKNGYAGLKFRELPNDNGYYSFFVRNVMQFDTKRVKLNCEGYCETCKNYRSITPALPLAIKHLTKPLKEGFFATNISFGSGNEKKPVYFVGVVTHKQMKKENFKGIHYLKFDTELSVPW